MRCRGAFCECGWGLHFAGAAAVASGSLYCVEHQSDVNNAMQSHLPPRFCVIETEGRRVSSGCHHNCCLLRTPCYPVLLGALLFSSIVFSMLSQCSCKAFLFY